jgi:hypothetical protein
VFAGPPHTASLLTYFVMSRCLAKKADNNTQSDCESSPVHLFLIFDAERAHCNMATPLTPIFSIDRHRVTL